VACFRPKVLATKNVKKKRKGNDDDDDDSDDDDKSVDVYLANKYISNGFLGAYQHMLLVLGYLPERLFS